MKAEDVVLGMEVFTDCDPEYVYTVATLPNEKGEVTLEREGETDTYNVRYVEPYNLERFKEIGAKVQAKIDEAKNAFETAFKAYEAAKDMSYNEEPSLGMYSLKKMGLLNMDELHEAIERHGWSSSSLNC